MRVVFPSVLFSILLSVFAVQKTDAAEGVITPSQGSNCQSLRSNNEESIWRCPGPAGAFMEYFDFVTHAGLSFGWGKRALKPTDPEGLGWAPNGNGLSSRIEWRVANGRPFAAIIGRWRQQSASALTFEELVVIKLSEGEACKIAVLGALAPDAMRSARSVADERALAFRCGVDKPIETSALSNALLTLWDYQFGDREILTHNESIVELVTAAGGAIEIRYIEPRKELKINPGTLLFRGTARNGKLMGEAYLFRPDCAPAGYPVAGARKDGILVLEGTTPQRATRSCEIIAGAGKPSRLAFEREPVLQTVRSVPQQTVPDTIADCSRCIAAATRSVEGVDSGHASIAAQITGEDIRSYCENEALSEDVQAQCVKEHAGEIGKLLRATADCTSLTIEPSAGGRFKFYKMGEDYGGTAPVWINLEKNEIECGARACAGPSASAQFALMCPSAIPRWKGHWANHR